MTILETVHQLQQEIETEIQQGKKVFTMARDINVSIPYLEVSEMINRVASEHKRYVGSIRWIRKDDFTAEIRIGIAKTLKHWVLSAFLLNLIKKCTWLDLERSRKFVS